MSSTGIVDGSRSNVESSTNPMNWSSTKAIPSVIPTLVPTTDKFNPSMYATTEVFSGVLR